MLLLDIWSAVKGSTVKDLLMIASVTAFASHFKIVATISWTYVQVSDFLKTIQLSPFHIIFIPY